MRVEKILQLSLKWYLELGKNCSLIEMVVQRFVTAVVLFRYFYSTALDFKGKKKTKGVPGSNYFLFQMEAVISQMITIALQILFYLKAVF